MTKRTQYKGNPNMCTCSNSETKGRCVLHDPSTKHTPGTWKVEGQSNGLFSVYGNAGNAPETPLLVAQDLREANARYIAKAVNCHAELLGALKELEALRKMPHPSGDLDAAVAYRQRERDAVALSKAAIAKAERR